MNVPPTIGLAMSLDRPRVSLADLQTVYSVRDLHDLLEVGVINGHNARVMKKRSR